MVGLKSGFPFSSGHVQTLFPPLLRPKPAVRYERQRLETSDGDFIDLDWSRRGRRRLVVILHGLEGHSGRTYVLGMVRAANQSGFDGLAMNFRGCSGEPNRRPGMYHSGWTRDLHETLCMVTARYDYDSIDLIGFSLGANIILKYLGEHPGEIPVTVRRAVAFSVPCDLEDSSRALARPQCRMYMQYLLDQLRGKVIQKERAFPGLLDVSGIDRIRTFQEFDDRYTAPLHGFDDAFDYWRKSSCKQFLHGITRPTCIVNALNDPFLGPQCYPRDEVRRNANLHLLTPDTGGHVGFVGTSGSGGMYWSEWIAMRFLLHADCVEVQSCAVF